MRSSRCQRSWGELLQLLKAAGSAGHAELNKMRASAGHKSVICDQRINLELQPLCHYYCSRRARAAVTSSQPSRSNDGNMPSDRYWQTQGGRGRDASWNHRQPHDLQTPATRRWVQYKNKIFHVQPDQFYCILKICADSEFDACNTCKKKKKKKWEEKRVYHPLFFWQLSVSVWEDRTLIVVAIVVFCASYSNVPCIFKVGWSGLQAGWCSDSQNGASLSCWNKAGTSL